MCTFLAAGKSAASLHALPNEFRHTNSHTQSHSHTHTTTLAVAPPLPRQGERGVELQPPCAGALRQALPQLGVCNCYPCLVAWAAVFQRTLFLLRITISFASAGKSTLYELHASRVSIPHRGQDGRGQGCGKQGHLVCCVGLSGVRVRACAPAHLGGWCAHIWAAGRRVRGGPARGGPAGP